MKRTAVFLFSACMLALAACCEKVVKTGEVTGKWEFSEITAIPYGGTPGLNEVLDEFANSLVTVEPGATYTFKADKTGTYTDNDLVVLHTFTYSLSGNKLTIVMDNNPNDVRVETIQSITNSEMVWSEDITEEVNAEFTKITPGFDTYTKVLAAKHFIRK